MQLGPMQIVKWIATGVLVLPLAEIVAFVVVASQIGFAKALVLVLLISFFGVLVLRHAGAGQVTRLRTAAGGNFRTIALGGAGAGTALGGILLVIPGFVTGALGFLMIVPATRDWLVQTALRHLFDRPRQPPPGTIDLTPDEWQSLPDPEKPRRRRRTKPD
jgi:UPF0716 protein FxsA